MPGEVAQLINNNTQSEAGVTLLQLDGASGLSSLISPGNETVSLKVALLEADRPVKLRLEDVTDGDVVELTAVTGGDSSPGGKRLPGTSPTHRALTTATATPRHRSTLISKQSTHMVR